MKVFDMVKSVRLAYEPRAFIQTMTFIEDEHTTCHWENIRKCDGSFKWADAVSFQTFDFVTSSPILLLFFQRMTLRIFLFQISCLVRFCHIIYTVFIQVTFLVLNQNVFCLNVKIWEEVSASVAFLWEFIFIKRRMLVRMTIWVWAWFESGASLIDIIILHCKFFSEAQQLHNKIEANIFHFFLQIVSNGYIYVHIKYGNVCKRIQIQIHERRQKYGVIKYASF